jgi:hypothetical protein
MSIVYITPLQEKLGIHECNSAVFLHAPLSYFNELGQLPPSILVRNSLQGNSDFIHCFAKQRDILQQDFPKLKNSLWDHGMLWISIPKPQSHIETDISEKTVVEMAKEFGLVLATVTEIDEAWYGLKFIIQSAKNKV